MSDPRFVVSLPIADRPTSYAFYRDGLGLTAVGALADDGVPEPLQFALGEEVHLMLIPTGGFGWVIGDREVAGGDRAECLLSAAATDPASVDARCARAEAAGATVVSAPARQPWGYVATIADPDGHLWQLIADPPG